MACAGTPITKDELNLIKSILIFKGGKLVFCGDSALFV